MALMLMVAGLPTPLAVPPRVPPNTRGLQYIPHTGPEPSSGSQPALLQWSWRVSVRGCPVLNLAAQFPSVRHDTDDVVDLRAECISWLHCKNRSGRAWTAGQHQEAQEGSLEETPATCPAASLAVPRCQSVRFNLKKREENSMCLFFTLRVLQRQHIMSQKASNINYIHKNTHE